MTETERGENDNGQSLITTRLLVAAMNVCDRHSDGDDAREEMRQQCRELPPNLQRDLLDHFRTAHGLVS